LGKSSTVTVQTFTEGLTAIPESDFTHANVLNFMRKNRVAPDSLEPYTYFSSEHYTRNLICRSPVFELLAICWEIGQKSAIHNHRDQCCWMAMAYGKVQVHNFKLIRKDPATRFCELESSSQFVIETDSPQEVDPQEPIHQVLNLHSFCSRAVTLHVYSKPYDTCEVYDLRGKRYEDVRLVNTTEYGVLRTDRKLERVRL
jgi:cysteine dioxygenase